MKVVYALTTKGLDTYSVMTRMSIASLRKCNPTVEVLVYCDTDSAESLQALNDPLLREVDSTLSVPTIQGDNNFRNRCVKLSLRELVDGDFLFLDSDTIVLGPISPIFDSHGDIAGAANHSRDAYSEQIWSEDLEFIQKNGWTIKGNFYINGGVIFYRDSAGAREFARAWRAFYLKGYHATGRYRDQPALNAALSVSACEFALLKKIYNAQIFTAKPAVKDPVIVHYYSSMRNSASEDIYNFLSSIDAKRAIRAEDLSRFTNFFSL